MSKEHLKILESSNLSDEQRQLAEEFVTAYNAIDGHLRKHLGADRRTPFSSVVRDIAVKHPSWLDTDLLLTVAELRNVLVHKRTKPWEFVAVPTKGIVDRLKGLESHLLNPRRVHEAFQREVEILSVDDSLADALKIISMRDYSQFPIFAGDQFKGLLTENGITRWLANQVVTELSLIELNDIKIRAVLRKEEKRKNWVFVPRDETVDALVERFSRAEPLEAALITQHGKKTENLLGIATRWDILRV